MTVYRFDLPADSDLTPCPEACGGLTEDPCGGPCKACWDKVPVPWDDDDPDVALHNWQCVEGGGYLACNCPGWSS